MQSLEEYISKYKAQKRSYEKKNRNPAASRFPGRRALGRMRGLNFRKEAGQWGSGAVGQWGSGGVGELGVGSAWNMPGPHAPVPLGA